VVCDVASNRTDECSDGSDRAKKVREQLPKIFLVICRGGCVSSIVDIIFTGTLRYIHLVAHASAYVRNKRT
jgi:hypothetical protein